MACIYTKGQSKTQSGGQESAKPETLAKTEVDYEVQRLGYCRPVIGCEKGRNALDESRGAKGSGGKRR